MPLPFGLQLSVRSLLLLLESSLRLLFAVATAVHLCFGLIYFNLLGSNNISRPEVRKARKRVSGKLLDVATGKLQIVMQKENKGVFYSLLHVWMLSAFLYAHTHRWRRCPAVLLAAWKSIACMQTQTLPVTHSHKYICTTQLSTVCQSLTPAGLKNSYISWKKVLEMGLRQTISTLPSLPLPLKCLCSALL